MKILLISDGIPGHANQAKGLIEHLKNFKGEEEVIVNECVYPLKYHWMRPIFRWLLNLQVTFAEKLIYFGYGVKKISTDYDLILSAGGNTSFLNAQLGISLSTNNLYIGSLRGLKPELFKIILTLESLGTKNNILMPFAVCRTTKNNTLQAAKSHFKNEQPHQVWAMIIGGDGAHCHYQKNDWKQLAEAMQVISLNEGIKWLVTTSRRTGLANEKILKSLIPMDIIEEAVWYNHQPQKIMNAYLGRASMVFCTIDSMAMMSEAISSATRTIALRPEKSRLEERYQNALNQLQQQQLLTVIEIEKFSKSNLSSPDSASNEELENKINTIYQKLMSSLESTGIVN